MFEGYEELFTLKKNNFRKNENVDSDLIFGDLNRVEKPFITIAIPTYKRADLLKYAIMSAINQPSDKCDYEIIIVDNDPTESETESEKIVKSFDCDIVLYYRNKENLGMFGNWNRCVELARGEWVAFLHDDDILDSKYLSKVTRLLKRKFDIGAISSDFEVFYSDLPSKSKDIEKSHFKSIICKLTENKLMRLTIADSLILNGNVFGAPTCGSIYRKEYLLRSGGFDSETFPSADWFFTLKYSETYKFYKTRTLFGYYRVFENESLNPETLKRFIVQAEEVRKHYARNTKLGRFMDSLFANERYYSTLNWVKKYSTVNLEEINKEFDYSFRPIRYQIYKILISVYLILKRIITFIIG